MAYSDFGTQIKSRGATDISRSAEAKSTRFTFAGNVWVCSDKKRMLMTDDLEEGYEMLYCLRQYCSPFRPELVI